MDGYRRCVWRHLITTPPIVAEGDLVGPSTPVKEKY